jgi:hypothetical protein
MNIISKKAFYLFIITSVSLTGCFVSKKPYFQSKYYNKTISDLNNKKTAVTFTEEPVSAGFSKISITPIVKDAKGERLQRKERVPIAGFGQAKTKWATGVHDSIFVRAVAIKAGNDLSVILTADMLIMPPDLIDSLLVQLARKGIKREQLFFTATHTHSGIGGWGYGMLARMMAGKENPLIKNWLVSQMNNAVLMAVTDLKPALIASGSRNIPAFIRNRLTGNPDYDNNDLDYIIIKQENGRNGIITSYGAHATTVGRKNTLISADYPGYLVKKIEATENCFAMFCGGSMASQAPAGKGEQFENARYIGESLADSLLSSVNNNNLRDKIKTSSVSLKMSLPRYHMRMNKKIYLSTGLSRSLMARPENVYLQALRINNLIWYFTPGDFSGEMALIQKKLLAGKGFSTMITGYNGSYVGYIIPSKYFYMKHYEPVMMGWFGPYMGDYISEMMDRIGAVVTGEKNEN